MPAHRVGGLPPHSIEEALHGVLWADADLERISVDYDAVEFELSESTGRKIRVRCDGHIGICGLGFWDEAIVESAEALREDPIIDICVEAIRSRYGRPLPDTGCPARNAGNWALLRVKLIDGFALDIVAAHFSVTDIAEGV